MRFEVNVAMIGQGFMGKAHSNAYRQVAHFFDVPVDPRLKVICGRNQAGLDAMASRWGWEETETDWRAVIERSDVDLVDIAVPNALHGPIAKAAAEAGKMVLCEKPLAVSLAEAEEMAAVARGQVTGVWFNYRRVPAIAFTRQLIDEGRIGRVFHYRATYLQEWGNDPTRPPRWKFDPAIAGSGVLGDLLSHLIDTAIYLNGPISEVAAMMNTFVEGRQVDDATMLLARFGNGSVGTFEATRYAVGCKNGNAFAIHGSNGMARFQFEDMNRLEFFDAADARNLQGPRNLLVTGPDHPYWMNFWKPGHTIGYEHTFIATLAEFLLAVHRGLRFRPDFDDAVEVHRVLDAVERSSKQRQSITL